MKRSSTDTFIVELPISVNTETERKLSARLLAGTRLYNAALGEALKRLDLMRQSKRWQAARLLSGKERGREFKTLCAKFNFTSASVSSFATACKNKAGWKNRLSANETQRIAETAFSAVEQYSYGKRGRPRFKNRNRPLKSFTGKKNSTGICYRGELGIVKWAGLVMPVKYPPSGKDLWLEEALTRETKFSRLVWRKVKGKRRWYVQLAQTGQTPIKDKNATRHGDMVGLDLGPSSIAIVSEHDANLVSFCPSITQPWKEIRRIQRAMDRSKRSNNPQCFNEDGTWVRGKRLTNFSKRYLSLKNELFEMERKLASERKRSHGELVNSVIRLGNIVKTEKISYRAWQKNFGKSIKVKAPATFISELERKAERAGGKLVELNTQTLKMSQYDHVTGTYQKKSLNDRWHILGRATVGDVTLVQRDMYSAFLALCSDANEHQSSYLNKKWAVVRELLEQADWVRKLEVASGETIVYPTLKPSERLAC